MNAIIMIVVAIAALVSVNGQTLNFFVTFRDFQSKTRGFHPHFQNTAPLTIGTSICNQMVSTKLVEEIGSGIYKPTICEPELRNGALADGPRCGTIKSNPTSAVTCFDDTDPSVTAQELEFSTWYRDNFDSVGNRSTLINKRSAQVLTLLSLPAGGAQFDSGSGFFPLSVGVNSEETFNEVGNNGVGPAFNFYFTSEIHTFFEYRGGEVFNFQGDDDVWVYINDTLALDIGGIHVQTARNLSLDNIIPPLVRNTIYPLSLFHAERRVFQSNFKVTTNITSPCNVMNNGIRQLTLPSVDFEERMQLNGTSVISNQLILIDGTIFNQVGYAFTTLKQNVGTGFVSKFKFIASPNSQGFAFHVHDGSITDLNSANLGVSNFEKSLAVVFDLKKNEIRVHATFGKNNMSDSTKFAFAPIHPASNFADDLEYEVIIQSLVNPPVLEIYLANSLYIQKRNFLIENLIGSRTAFIGFTSTTGENSTNSGAVKITSWTFDTLTIQDNATVPTTQLNITQTIVANNFDRARFLFQTVDGCGNLVDFGGFSNRLHSTFTALNSTNEILDGIIFDANNGSYFVELKTDIVSEFSLNISFGLNCITQPENCFIAFVPNAVFAIEPPSTFVPTTSPITKSPTNSPAVTKTPTTSSPTVIDTCSNQGLCFTNNILDCCSIKSNNITCSDNPEAGYCTHCQCLKPVEIAKLERKSEIQCGNSGECFFECSKAYNVTKRGDEYRFESPPVNGCNCCTLRGLKSKTNEISGTILELICDGPQDLEFIAVQVKTDLININITSNGSVCSALYTETSGSLFKESSSDMLFYIAIGCAGYLFLVLCAVLLVWKCRTRKSLDESGKLYRTLVAYHLLNIVSFKRTYVFLIFNCIFAIMAYFIEQIEYGDYITGFGRSLRNCLVVSYAIFKLRGPHMVILLWFMSPFLITVYLMHWILRCFCLPSPFGPLFTWGRKAFLDLDQDDGIVVPKKVDIPLSLIKQMDKQGNLSDVSSRNSITPIRLIEKPIPEVEFQTFKRKKISKLSYPIQVCIISTLADDVFYKMEKCSIPLPISDDKSLIISGKLFMLYCGKSSKLNARQVLKDLKTIKIMEMDYKLYLKCVQVFMSDIRGVIINDASIILSLLIDISTVFEPDTNQKWQHLRNGCIGRIDFKIVNANGQSYERVILNSKEQKYNSAALVNFMNLPIAVDSEAKEKNTSKLEV